MFWPPIITLLPYCIVQIGKSTKRMSKLLIAKAVGIAKVRKSRLVCSEFNSATSMPCHDNWSMLWVGLRLWGIFRMKSGLLRAAKARLWKNKFHLACHGGGTNNQQQNEFIPNDPTTIMASTRRHLGIRWGFDSLGTKWVPHVPGQFLSSRVFVFPIVPLVGFHCRSPVGFWKHAREIWLWMKNSPDQEP